MRGLSTIGRVIAVGGAAGAASAVVATAVAAALGMDALTPELTASHVVAASLVANVAGAAGFVWLRARRAKRAAAWYALAALAIATAASVRVLVSPPLAGFAAVAIPIHYVVAGVSALAIPWLLAGPLSPVPRAASRGLVSIVALATAVSPEVADFNATHLENPLWPPHARYHGALLANAMVAIGVVSIALVWRPVPESERRLRVALAAGLPAAVWSGFFVALAFPDASSWPDGATRAMAVAPNVIVAGVLVALAILAWWLDR